MKKLLILSLMLVTVGIAAPMTEAKPSAGTTSVAVPEPQVWGRRRGRNWNRGRVRSVIRTRIVWRYGRRYRETYRITYLPNGRTRVHVIRRVPLNSYRRY